MSVRTVSTPNGVLFYNAQIAAETIGTLDNTGNQSNWLSYSN
ncbi:hypothetical protein ACI2IY_21765 [Lysobacter enzymogenes]